MTKEEYVSNLKRNIEELVKRLKSISYRPQSSAFYLWFFCVSLLKDGEYISQLQGTSWLSEYLDDSGLLKSVTG